MHKAQISLLLSSFFSGVSVVHTIPNISYSRAASGNEKTENLEKIVWVFYREEEKETYFQHEST